VEVASFGRKMYQLRKSFKTRQTTYTIRQQQQQKHVLTQIIYKAMIHEYTEYKISKIE